MIISTIFMAKYVYCIGIPVVYSTIPPIPVIPPVTNLKGAIKNFHVKA